MHHLMTEPFGNVRLYPFGSPKSGEGDGIALFVGTPESMSEPLLRIHSRCLYGEVFRSLDCDCLAQYEESVRLILGEGAGVLVYLEQEGRGCGIRKKAQAYELMERRALDSVQAFEELGLPLDRRSYTHVADLLGAVEIRAVRLLTNNPHKVRQLQGCGIRVSRVPLQVGANLWNIEYLRTKQRKLGHDLGLLDGTDAANE